MAGYREPGLWYRWFQHTGNGSGAGDQLELDLFCTFLYRAGGGYNFHGFGSRDARLQLMVWQSKSNKEDELPDGTGINLTLEQTGVSSGERFVARYSFSDGDAALVDQLFMFGWGREIRRYDHYGLSFGLGRSAGDSSIWQGVAEGYYRCKVTREFMVTPDLQIKMGKGLSNGEAIQIVAGLRGSITV